MTKWYDIFLWIWMGAMVVSTSCLSIIGIRKVGLFGGLWSPGWIEEFDSVDKKILKFAGYILFAGFVSLGVFAILYLL